MVKQAVSHSHCPFVVPEGPAAFDRAAVSEGAVEDSDGALIVVYTAAAASCPSAARWPQINERGMLHYHIAVLADRNFRLNPFKKKLLKQGGLVHALVVHSQ